MLIYLASLGYKTAGDLFNSEWQGIIVKIM